jgi:pheromone shutdown-related protein TraB
MPHNAADQPMAAQMNPNAQAAASMRQVRIGRTLFHILGTAHVSRESAEEVRSELRSGRYDAVAIELCSSRHRALTDPQQLADMDLFQALRQGKAGMIAASLALGAYQQRLAEQFGIQPGAEMRAAMEAADAGGLPVLLIDRDIGVTLKRVYRGVHWWQRLGLLAGLGGSLFSRQRISEADIERLKQGDILEATFAEFAERSPALYRTLIAERDRFMAAKLLAEAADRHRNVLVVVGAGHVDGLARELAAFSGEPAQALAALNHVPPASAWPRIIPWLIVGVILAGFAYGFSQDVQLGWRLVVDWILINGALCALGSLIALAHPLTIAMSFVAAPLTSLNPTIGAGFVAAATELAVRKPTVADFAKLRSEVARPRGWWTNRVARVLLVFVLSTLGSAAGTYIAGFRIAERLLG